MSERREEAIVNVDKTRTIPRLPFAVHLARLSLVLVVTLGSVGCSQHRMRDGPPLQIHRQLTGDKFTYDSPAEEPVWDWFQLDLAFVSTLEQRPAALEEARKATPFRKGYWITFAGWTAFTIKTVHTIATFSEDPTSSAYEAAKGDLAVMAGFTVGIVVFDAFARRYVNRGVSLFNAEEMRSTEERAGEENPLGRFPAGLELAPTYRPAAGLGWAVRIGLR